MESAGSSKIMVTQCTSTQHCHPKAGLAFNCHESLKSSREKYLPQMAMKTQFSTPLCNSCKINALYV
jgi:hypothetical protein